MTTAIDCLDDAHGKNWSLFNADCVEFVPALPADSLDLAIYSPPFSNLYCYSDSDRDMGNAANDAEFIEHYRFLIADLYRAMRPGRVVAVHCKDLVNYAGSSADGMAGLRDFPGWLIAAHKECGFSWHARVTIWRDPVVEMQKTKAHGLLYKQLRTDSTFSRMGMGEYVLFFRKWADEEKTGVVPVSHTRDEFTLDQWQKWASPIWTDIDYTDVLNVHAAREDRDEKHMCPLPLPVIERCVGLYSNPSEVVFSPYAGVGSEGVQALRMGRKFVGTELKTSYFEQARKYLKEAEIKKGQRGLFDVGAA